MRTDGYLSCVQTGIFHVYRRVSFMRTDVYLSCVQTCIFHAYRRVSFMRTDGYLSCVQTGIFHSSINTFNSPLPRTLKLKQEKPKFTAAITPSLIAHTFYSARQIASPLNINVTNSINK